MRVYLKLLAESDFNGWTKGDVYEMENEVFCKKTGIAYFSIDKNWKILEMRLIEYKHKIL